MDLQILAQACRSVVVFLFISISDSMNYYSCHKCDVPYNLQVVPARWYHDREYDTWYCPSCTREAWRDSKKELHALTNKHFCSTEVYEEARRQCRKEFWKVLRRQMPKNFSLGLRRFISVTWVFPVHRLGQCLHNIGLVCKVALCASERLYMTIVMICHFTECRMQVPEGKVLAMGKMIVHDCFVCNSQHASPTLGLRGL